VTADYFDSGMRQIAASYGPSPDCQRSGCQLAAARVLLVQAQQMAEYADRALDGAQRLAGRTTEGERMSACLWCDAGEHPFSARDPESEVWKRKIKTSDGQTVEIDWDVCGPCKTGAAPGFNLTQRHAIMTGKVPGLDHDAT